MSDVPAWAALLGDRYGTFRDVVVAELARLDIEVEHSDIDVGVVCAGEARYGLTNILRVCRGAPEERWPELVADHLRRCAARLAAASSWTPAVEQLRLRLVPARHLDGGGDHFVARQLANGLYAAAAIDLAEAVRFVARKDLEAWDRSEDELFELAAANTRAEPALEYVEHEGIAMLVGDSYYAASHVLWLERYVEVRPHGQIVAVPDRHCVIAAPVAIDSLVPVARLAAMRFAEEPGALTDQLYWRRPTGELVELPCGFGDDGHLWIRPPADFARALTARATA